MLLYRFLNGCVRGILANRHVLDAQSPRSATETGPAVTTVNGSSVAWWARDWSTTLRVVLVIAVTEKAVTELAGVWMG